MGVGRGATASFRDSERGSRLDGPNERGLIGRATHPAEAPLPRLAIIVLIATACQSGTPPKPASRKDPPPAAAHPAPSGAAADAPKGPPPPLPEPQNPREPNAAAR